MKTIFNQADLTKCVSLDARQYFVCCKDAEPAEKSAEELEAERVAAQAAVEAARAARPQTKVSHKKLNTVKVRPRFLLF